MKNMITMMIGIVIGAITILIILTVTGRMNYAAELESQLPAVVEDTLCNAKMKQSYHVADNKEFIADVTEQLASELDAQTGIDVRVMGSDVEKGLLSVEVVRNFLHPNGRNGTVTDSRTVLTDKLQKQAVQKYYVKFYTDESAESGICYKQYLVMTGNTVPVPADPVKNDKKFAGWQDDKGYEADFSQPVEQNRDYYAVWE